ncbi:MAG: hypothetical protein LUF86_06315 [Clostridiales bacterium]|nr:hypothetical protein [Clostridiales bacterium]
MEENKKEMTEQKKESVIQRLWLTYYNDTLYDKGVITEEERNRMRVAIKTRAASMGRAISKYRRQKLLPRRFASHPQQSNKLAVRLRA